MDEVTATEAAQLTGLSERTIRRKIACGELPARRIAPNRFAIRVRDLPMHRSTSEAETRIEALEHRVRLLEIQLEAVLSSRDAGLIPADMQLPHGDSASDDNVVLHSLLEQLIHEIRSSRAGGRVTSEELPDRTQWGRKQAAAIPTSEN